MIITNSDVQLCSADIDAFEKRHRLSLPRSYREFLLRHNGGVPERAHYIFLRDGKKNEWSWVDVFHSLTPKTYVYTDIEDMPDWRRMEIPTESVRIGSGPGDQDILLYHAGPRAGQVWLKDFGNCRTEGDANEQLHLISKTFDSFLNLLQEAPPHLR